MTMQERIESLEKDLRDQERKYQTLADYYPYIVVRYDTNFRRIYANKTYAQTFGVDIESILNTSVDEVWPSNKHVSLTEFKGYLKHVIQHKVPENFFITWFSTAGKKHFREIYLIPEFDEAGEVISVLGIDHETNMYKNALQELCDLNNQLQSLTAKRESAREEERKHIAREIHDELGQLISVIRLHAAMIDDTYGKLNPDLHQKAGKIVKVADQAIDSIRNMITQLRPVELDDGFIYALECLVADFYTNTEIECELDIPQLENGSEDLPEINEQRALVIFRIVQEALTNILRHAKASKVVIHIFFEAQSILLIVKDNGLGFNPDEVCRKGAFGLIGMRERAQVLQGELDIISNYNLEEDHGTEVRMRIPINEK